MTVRRPGRNGGQLIEHPPGSNGGVHRGPDRFPRRNVLRAIVLKALSDPGVDLDRVTGKKTLEQLWRTGRSRGKARLAFAMMHHAAEALKAMAVRAERGNPQAVDQLLRFIRDAHEILQPTKDEAKNGDMEPIRPIFRRGERSTAPGTEPVSQEPPASPLTVDGQEYE